MSRRSLWLLPAVLLSIVPWQRGHAQQPPPAPVTMPGGALSPEQARAALETLNDPKKRAAVAATLQAVIQTQAAQPPAAPPPPSATPAPAEPAPAAAPGASPGPPPGVDAKPAPAGIAIQLAPNSLGAQVLLSASSFLNDTVSDLSDGMKAIQSVPLLWGWAVVMVTNPLGQQLLRETGWRLVATLLLALGVELALRILLRRPLARVLIAGGARERPPRTGDAEAIAQGGAGENAPVEAPDDAMSRAERGAIEPPAHSPEVGHRRPRPARRFGLGFARFALEMVPILGLLIAGHMAAASELGGPQGSRLVILAVLDAIVACQTLLAILTLLFSPEPPGLRLLPLRPAAGAYSIRWGRRLILIAVPGYAIGVVALLLGLSPPAHAALQKCVGLAITICLIIIVVQRRRSVRRWLSAKPDASGIVAWSRNGLARQWHWIALFFLVAGWLAWTLGAPDAFARILWYFVMTAGVVLVAAIARAAVLAVLGSTQPEATAGASAPANPLRTRLSVYNPAILRLVTLVINVIALLALSQLYGVGGLSWLLTTDVGQRVVSGVVTLTVTIALAFAVWEGVNIAIQMHLETLRAGAQAARSARLRTLLPLIRTTLAITVAVVAGLMVLSEIGVNIAPLLAGAGIVGVAIGFGSQKLVQDVITGVFLLLENTMQVGDVVKVGDQSGLVESLSVRTIRLRTEDGSVVVIPFSAVTTVINMTRDYSRAVITVNVAADEDIDRVVDTLRAILREMREEDAWSTIILDDLEVFGLDRITDTALQIKCRVMCSPFGRWPVGREFNRRLKARFQIVGVATPFSALQLMAPSGTGLGGAPARGASASGSDGGMGSVGIRQ